MVREVSRKESGRRRRRKEERKASPFLIQLNPSRFNIHIKTSSQIVPSPPHLNIPPLIYAPYSILPLLYPPHLNPPHHLCSSILSSPSLNPPIIKLFPSPYKACTSRGATRGGGDTYFCPPSKPRRPTSPPPSNSDP